MNRNFKFYLYIWTILFVLFNVVIFVVHPKVAGVDKFDSSFLTSYISIIIAFIIQLAVSFIALKEEKSQKLFYNIPIVSISFAGLVVIVLVGVWGMLVPNLPNWVVIIVCCGVLAFYAIAVIMAKTAANIVSGIDVNTNVDTSFIRNMTADAEVLMKKVQGEKEKLECKKVYEAIRFSNPRSYAQTEEVEKRIEMKFRLFEAMIGDVSIEKIQELSSELIGLTEERNQKCKLQQRG